MKENNMSAINYLALLSVFLFAGAGTFMNAAVQTMIEAWPDVSVTTVRMVVSLPPLVSLPVMLLTGGIVGKKLSYRFCAIFGTLLIALGGVAPFFVSTSWTLVLVFRAILGVGVGFLGMRNALLTYSVPGEKNAAFTGYGNALFNGGAMIAAPVVGILSQFSWRHPFLFDALALIPAALMIVFLKEPAVTSPAEEKAVDQPAEKGSFTWRAYYYIVMMFLTTGVLYPLLSGLSTYVAAKNIGSPALVGSMLSAYTLGGVVANIVLGPIMGALKKNTLPVTCLAVAVCAAGVLFAPSVPVLFAACFVAGACFGILLSTFLIYNGRVSHPSVMALGSTLILAMLQLGVFISAYFITFCHMIFHRASDVESSYMGTLICYLVFAVIAFVVRVAPQEDYSMKK